MQEPLPGLLTYPGLQLGLWVSSHPVSPSRSACRSSTPAPSACRPGPQQACHSPSSASEHQKETQELSWVPSEYGSHCPPVTMEGTWRLPWPRGVTEAQRKRPAFIIRGNLLPFERPVVPHQRLPRVEGCAGTISAHAKERKLKES